VSQEILLGGSNLDGHDLADAGTFDNNDKRANSTVMTTPLFASLNICDNEWVADICARNDMGLLRRRKLFRKRKKKRSQDPD